MGQMSESRQFDSLLLQKKIDVSYSCVRPFSDDGFCHNIVKVVCGSTQLSPCGSTATLTMSG